jgi:predicted RNA-binding Zn-ribbon protein involved in translation (DUF1610 family)
MKANLPKSKEAKTSEQQKGMPRDQARSGEQVQAVDLNGGIDLERREAYIEPKTRALLRELLQSEEKPEIIPKYNPGYGFGYQLTGIKLDKPELNNLPRDFLENLVRLDILVNSFYDSVSVCPFCNSTIITLHNRCPKCKSHDIDKTGLTEHIPCGFIDQRNKYVDNVCPKCGERLIEGQYRNMGRWFVCRDCGERFEDPEYDLNCRNCNKVFTIKEARLLEIPKFALNLNRKKEIRQNVASLESFRELLANMGFSVEMPGLMVGQKSGMQHQFSLVAKKQVKDLEILIALDHAVSESEVSSNPLILYIYKTSEVKVDIPIFVAMPQLNETARKIAQGHEILLIEGSPEEKGAMEKIRSDIESRIEMKIIEEEAKKKLKNGKSGKSSVFSKLTGLTKKT